MERFAATLVAEGSSDQALVPLVEFVLDEHCDVPHVTTFAGDLPNGPLHERISRALALHPCNLLFVHRDADRASVALRDEEIRAAALLAQAPGTVCVIPVRMTEAWLLVDQAAIRRASGNTTDTASLGIPPIARLEALADPKQVLFAALEKASELGPHRLRRFDRHRARRQVSGFMDDPSLLRALPSFAHFESQVRQVFAKPEW
jgi:class 3 adenylate cyclase